LVDVKTFCELSVMKHSGAVEQNTAFRAPWSSMWAVDQALSCHTT